MNRNFEQAAKELGCYETYLRRHTRDLPHHRFGRTVVFTDDDITEIRAMFRVAPAKPSTELRPAPGRRSLQRRTA